VKTTALVVAAFAFGASYVGSNNPIAVTSACHCPHPDSVAVDSVASILAPRARDTAAVRPIAQLIVREARTKRLDPVLVANIVRVENPWLLADTVSRAGATGIMQVMPLWAGSFSCSGPLDDAGTSVCLGTAIFAAYLKDALRAALLSYNGCTSLRCRGYAEHVTDGL